MSCCNHDCNQGRSCEALGVCQDRKPPCAGCSPKPLRLAPGVLEGHKVGLLGSPAQQRELVRYLRQLLGWGAVLVVGGLLVGVMSGALP